MIREQYRMMLFDSHCHLDDRWYENDRDDVIDRANAAGVKKMMIVGTAEHSSKAAVSLAEAEAGIYAAVGFHPHDAKDCSEKDLESIRSIARSRKVRAWGEIGLDFNRMYSPRNDQERWLIRQLEIADDLSLPLIFHERDSEGRLIEILTTHSRNGRNGVIHCFSGNRSELEQYLSMGFHIGITGIVTLKERGAPLREMSPLIPSDRLLIETDAPYLTPTPERNRVRRNEPAFVKTVLLKLADVRGEDPEALAVAIWENTCRLFHIND
jgi:TatD DNase family protein